MCVCVYVCVCVCVCGGGGWGGGVLWAQFAEDFFSTLKSGFKISGFAVEFAGC